jgi:hypothetical protein
MASLDTVGHGDELNAVALEPPVEAQRLDEVPRQAREIIDQDDGEGGRRRQRGGDETLIGRAVLHAEAREGRVLIDSEPR